jgi:ribosomal protein S18 acetylase RimI-like enzyme
MEIESPDTTIAGDVTDMWVDLAAGQREFGSHLRTDENRTRIRESVVRHIVTDTLLVAREDEDLVGFVMFSVESGSFDQDVRRGVIENLFVDESHRRETVGAQLLEAAEEVLRERDVEVVALEVMWANESAREFYADRGYEPHRMEVEKALESDTD